MFEYSCILMNKGTIVHKWTIHVANLVNADMIGELDCSFHAVYAYEIETIHVETFLIVEFFHL